MDRLRLSRPVFLLFGGRAHDQRQKRNWKPQTALVHAGTLRSGFGETSEAMYLTQGYVYDSAEAAEARFKGEEPGFIYSRYANPTVDMFEKRMCALEGAEDARATASGMAAVTAPSCAGAGRRPHRRGARAVRLLPLGGRDAGAEIRHRDARWSTAPTSTNWEKAVRPNTKLFFLESPTNPTLEVIDIARRRRRSPIRSARG